MTRAAPAGDFDYERHGTGYAARRQPDPRVAAFIHRALGDARTVLNVGAGAGSYEPDDRYVVAVEPSAAMRPQRRPDRVPAIDAIAERLLFDDDSFDAAMATVTIHQWSDPDIGLREMRRVSRGVVAILTFLSTATPRTARAWSEPMSGRTGPGATKATPPKGPPGASSSPLNARQGRPASVGQCAALSTVGGIEPGLLEHQLPTSRHVWA